VEEEGWESLEVGGTRAPGFFVESCAMRTNVFVFGKCWKERFTASCECFTVFVHSSRLVESLCSTLFVLVLSASWITRGSHSKFEPILHASCEHSERRALSV
jgi:hypothetical protein